ncbi:hypothetical protein [Dysgonomonas sp. 25]|uniref:hypothetical protein n=1 Tax=Dysgonomonas sp. 25 TaxID=2302933 RepID=UPI0013D3BA6B|nr:hypothetical protein [Dysgonomonas sp. 25]NDV67808.1 hypothetical protein [Dysgonomonas sp. 25]
MKLLKSTYIGLFVTLSLLLSVSCSDSNHDYVKRGTLDFSTESYPIIPETRPDGTWEANVTFTLNDISNLYAGDDLYGIEIYQSSFELWLQEGLYFRTGDDIIIQLQNDNGEPLSINYIIDRPGINNLYIDDSDEEYYYFVRAFFNRLYNNGSVRLYIVVDMVDRYGPIVGQPFDVYFTNDLDLYIRN